MDQVVLWDFDGTLARREGMWRSALVGALDAVAPAHGITGDDLRPGLRDGFPWHRHEVPHPEFTDADAWWVGLHPVLRRAYEGAGVARPAVEQAIARVRDVYLDPRHWSVFDDVRPALERLRAAGWSHVVLSNHVPELPRLVADLGLADLVEDVLTSALLGYEKPHPAAYEAALERAGRPRAVWMVGDSAEADVRGARSAGIPALLVRQDESHGLAWAAGTILGRSA